VTALPLVVLWLPFAAVGSGNGDAPAGAGASMAAGGTPAS